MTKSAFRAAAIKWLAWLFGATISLYVLLLTLGALEMCKGSASPCLPFMVAFFFFARPLALLVFALLIAWAIHKRVSALGLGVGWSIAALIWLFGALPLLAFGVNTWKMSFLVGLLTSSRLDLLAFALSLIAFLSYAEPSAVHNSRSDMRLAWIVAIAIAVHFTLLQVPSILGGLSLIPILGAWIHRVLHPVFMALQYASLVAWLGVPGRHLFWLQWFDVAIFSAALGYLIANQDKEDDAPSGTLLTRPRPVAESGSAAPRATFGRRGS